MVLKLVKEGIDHSKSVWGWGIMTWTEKKTGRGWGIKGVTLKNLKLLMGREQWEV